MSHKKKSTVSSCEFQCDRGDCGKTFSKAFGLIHHLNLHDNNLYKCYFCPWGCSAGLNQSIDIHLNQHFGTPQYDCSFCDKKFYWKQHLTTHMEIYHEKIEGKYGCSYCQYKTHSKVSLCLHIGPIWFLDHKSWLFKSFINHC